MVAITRKPLAKTAAAKARAPRGRFPIKRLLATAGLFTVAAPTIDISTEAFNEANSGWAPSTNGSTQQLSAAEMQQLRQRDQQTNGGLSFEVGGMRVTLGVGGEAAHAQAGPIGVGNGGGAPVELCTGGDCPTPGGEDSLPFINIPIAVVAALTPEKNPTNDERFGVTVQTLAGIETNDSLVRLDGADNAALIADVDDNTAAASSMDFSFESGTPVVDQRRRPITTYGGAAAGVALFGPDGLFLPATPDNLGHIWGAITPNEWDARMRALPAATGQIQVTADGEIFVGNVQVRENQIQSIDTPEYGRVAIGIQRDNRNLESYVLIDAPARAFGDISVDGTFTDAGWWRSRDGVLGRLVNNITSLMFGGETEHQVDPMSDGQRYYQRGGTYTTADGEERVVLIIGAHQTQANIWEANLSVSQPTRVNFECASDGCGPFVDATLTRSDRDYGVRVYFTRQDGNSVVEGFQMLDADGEPTGTRTTNLTATGEDSLVGADRLDAQLFRALTAKLPDMTTAHDRVQDALEALDRTDIQLDKVVGDANAAADAVDYQLLEGSLTDSRAAAMVTVGSTTYRLDFTYGAHGQLPETVKVYSGGNEVVYTLDTSDPENIHYETTNAPVGVQTLEDCILMDAARAARDARPAPRPVQTAAPAEAPPAPFAIQSIVEWDGPDADTLNDDCLFKITLSNGTEERVVYMRADQKADGANTGFDLSFSDTVDGEFGNGVTVSATPTHANLDAIGTALGLEGNRAQVAAGEMVMGDAEGGVAQYFAKKDCADGNCPGGASLTGAANGDIEAAGEELEREEPRVNNSNNDLMKGLGFLVLGAGFAAGSTMLSRRRRRQVEAGTMAERNLTEQAINIGAGLATGGLFALGTVLVATLTGPAALAVAGTGVVAGFAFGRSQNNWISQAAGNAELHNAAETGVTSARAEQYAHALMQDKVLPVETRLLDADGNFRNPLDRDQYNADCVSAVRAIAGTLTGRAQLGLWTGDNQKILGKIAQDDTSVGDADIINHLNRPGFRRTIQKLAKKAGYLPPSPGGSGRAA